MIKSMTGYGRVQDVVSGYQITVEMRSVNHRYYEFSPRIPRVYGYLEDKLKTLVHESISRGKIDIFVNITATDCSDVQVKINRTLAESYLLQLRSLGDELGLQDDLTLSKLTVFGDIFAVERTEVDEAFIWDMVQSAAQGALDQLMVMRGAEGQKTKEDILGRLQAVETHLTIIEDRSPQTVKEYQNRLYDKLAEVLTDHQIDEGRLLAEAALYADKIAVDEETVRLRSHLEQMYSILEEPQPVGRKLDFLMQELNREINTIGSKSQNLEINRLVVEIKSELEKIREQVQNIE